MCILSYFKYAKTRSRVPPGSIADERERRDVLDSSSELVAEPQVWALNLFCEYSNLEYVHIYIIHRVH